ncbi:AAA family ATPase [Bradyrhizobium sp. AUGA SZCCT0182]|uniref:ATP-binding protein n=1 Tax=Bradyrhizobium sp. AUGA SZCCT0182 TaxID=2807667 RepID=UPI001BA4B0B5|nr:adenylate/guanylate cyclase domain-containing protein [Bradyrhizobium sp. AUGA SZCCT0182]MBR1237324.1 AAA family ATPase [Bradyrhizobium sp. AUGA SZCCT0182]
MAQLREWLEARGLGRYADALLAQDIELDILPELTDADLTAAGLPVGARKRLLQAIEGNLSDAAMQSMGAPPIVPTTEPATEAERRQLTVLFCDVVGSTHLAETLDAEDLRNLLLSFQKVCAEVVQRHEGQIGLFIGDGVTAYFGYPRAHEDSAQRAVQTGLDIMAGLTELGREGLEARCGVNTGPVVVGELGVGEKRLCDGIVGEAPNIAARLQGLALPGSLVMSEATLRLVEGLFEVEPLGPQMLKGVSAPIAIYRVLRPSAAPNRFEARGGQFLTPPIGRETELGFLTKRWENAMEGEGQAVLLQGEAGIGKSRLLQTLRMQLRETPHAEIVFYGSPQHQTSALWPVIQQLHRALGVAGEKDDVARRERLGHFLLDLGLDSADVVGPLAMLLGLSADSGSDAGPADPGQVRQAVFAALSQLTSAVQRRNPVLVVVEDAHWIDPSTTEYVGQMLSDMASQRLFVLLTARPEFRAPWSNSSPLVTLPLARLSRRETEAMIRRVAADDFPAAMLAQLVAKTDGVPLFIEELTKSVAESRSNVGFGGAIEIPATLQAALHARLDRLAPIRHIIQVAALLGRVFDADLLIAVSQRDAAAVKRALHDLIEAELIYPRRDPHCESYQFKHALIQDAAIGTLLRNQRAQLHRQIAVSLVELRADAVGRNPELLAHHLQEACDWGGALDHWQKAGVAAMARAASREAVSHFANAIDCSKRLDDVTGGAERMTRLHLAMANALTQAEGFRSERLSQALDAARRAASATALVELQCEAAISLSGFFYAIGRNRDYLTLADEQLKNHADLLPPACVSGLWSSKGTAHFNRGEWRFAIDALRKARDLIDRTHASRRILLGGADQLIATQSYFFRSLVAMGFIDEAVETTECFVQTIDRMEKPFDIAWGLLVKCYLYALLGQNDVLLRDSAKLIEISERHGYTTRLSNGLSWRGLARSRLGELDAGIADAREGIVLWRGQGIVFHTPERICWLCDLLVRAGRLDEASQLLDETDALVIDTDEAAALAECIRIRGQIAACGNDLTGAVHLFEKAIAISQRQEARLFKLRATTQLASVLARQGRAQEGAARLHTIIDAFDTKHEIVDLAAARKVLDTLRR